MLLSQGCKVTNAPTCLLGATAKTVPSLKQLFFFFTFGNSVIVSATELNVRAAWQILSHKDRGKS